MNTESISNMNELYLYDNDKDCLNFPSEIENFMQKNDFNHFKHNFAQQMNEIAPQRVRRLFVLRIVKKLK